MVVFHCDCNKKVRQVQSINDRITPIFVAKYFELKLATAASAKKVDYWHIDKECLK